MSDLQLRWKPLKINFQKLFLTGIKIIVYFRATLYNTFKQYAHHKMHKN